MIPLRERLARAIYEHDPDYDSLEQPHRRCYYAADSVLAWLDASLVTEAAVDSALAAYQGEKRSVETAMRAALQAGIRACLGEVKP